MTSTYRIQGLLTGVGMAMLYAGYMLVWVLSPESSTAESGGSFLKIAACMVTGIALLVFAGQRQAYFDGAPQRLLVCLPLLAYFLVVISASLFHRDITGFSYLLFGVVYFAVLAISDTKHIDLNKGMLILGCITVGMYIVFNLGSLTDYSGGRQRVSTNKAFGLTGYAFGIVFISALISFIHAPRYRLVSALLAVSSLYLFTATGTRSIFIGVALATLLITFSQNSLQRSIKYIAMMLVTATALVLIVSMLPQFDDRIDAIMRDMHRGYYALTGEYTGELSSWTRYVNRQRALDSIVAHPLLGEGYKTFWIDFPVLQAFQDFGVLFGLIFFLAMVAIPCYYAVNFARTDSITAKTVAALYALNLPRLFLHGQPYDWSIFTFVLPVYGLILSDLLIKHSQTKNIPASTHRSVDELTQPHFDWHSHRT